MAGTQLTCPQCRAMLSFSEGLAANATVRCLMCDATFAVRPATAAPVPPAPAKVAPRRATARPAVVAAPPSGSARGHGTRRRVLAPFRRYPGRRALGGVILTAVALLLLGGLAVLVWTQLADRWTKDENSDAPGPVAFTAPIGDRTPPVADGPSSPSVAPTGEPKKPAVNEPKKGDTAPKDPDGVDVADLKPKPSPAPPTPPAPDPKPTPPEPPGKPDPEPKRPEPPTVPIVIPGTPAAPGVDAARVDAAIARGVRFLKERQQADGSWSGGPALGYAALCGLALLECQVPADDPAVRNAAQYVRATVLGNNQVYEVAAAILFLDRLGNQKDRDLIRNLSLRLMAYQNPAGGWGYTGCVVYPVDPAKFQGYLRTHFPRSKDGKNKDWLPVDLQKLPVKELSWNQWSPFMLNPGDNSNTQFALLALWAARRQDVPAECPILLSYQRFLTTQNADGGWGYPGPVTLPGFPPPRPIPPGTPIPPGAIPPGFFPAGGLPGMPFGPVPPGGGLGPMPPGGMPPGGIAPPGIAPPGINPPGGMPAGGGWGAKAASTPTMTCVGLLGMAMGYGAVPADAKAADGDKLENPAIQNGLRLLALSVGTPAADANARPSMQNLYLLWSIERVAMLYDLKTIGGKDWYGWGAQILLANQGGDGSWSGGGYTGATSISDTCFALLFLKRSNLMPDLTANLRLRMVIRDPGAK